MARRNRRASVVLAVLPFEPVVLSRRVFGDFSRFRVDEFRTRFGSVEWMVFDAERVDPLTGLAACVRQAATEAEAVAGLE